MEKYAYIFSLVIYRHPEIPNFDMAIGVIAGSDEVEEWIYYPFVNGIQTIEDSLSECVDIGRFWQEHVIDEIIDEESLIDKYVKLLNSNSKYLLYEPLVRWGANVQWIVKSVEVAMEAESYLLVNGEGRFDNVLKKEAIIS